MEAAVDSTGPEAWQKTSIAEFGSQAVFTTFGVLDDDTSGQRGVVSSTHVRDGRICSTRIDNAGRPDVRASRATLQEGDLAVVLVRRTGDAALVTAQHAGWTATRSVGIIRADPHIVRWLRVWLQTPTAKTWIDEEVTAHVEPTLSLDSLRRMPFALPPTEVITKFDRAISLVEEKIDLNQETALKTLELADAIHAEWSPEGAMWETRQLGALTRARTGKGSARSLLPRADSPGIDGITPTDLFDLSVPYLESSRLACPADASDVWAPGTLMLATRPDGAHIAMTQRPASPTRGVLAVSPLDTVDGWWLLHELRSRSSALAGVAQGQNAREISARAFSRLSVAWPDASTRARFHEVAGPLHAMARKLAAESSTLYDLKDALLRDISARASALLEELPNRDDPDPALLRAGSASLV
jgi:type I restriction enzyme S subunit